MARYRPVYIEIWNDEDEFLNYSDKEKVLFMYLITNNNCTESGVYKISPKNICFVLNWQIEDFDPAIEKLKPNVFYDKEKKIVFVKNFYKYNGRVKGNPALILKSIQKDRQNFDTFLWHSFIETYPKFAQSLDKVSYDNNNNLEFDNDNKDEESLKDFNNTRKKLLNEMRPAPLDELEKAKSFLENYTV
jgi:hypothetical protein